MNSGKLGCSTVSDSIADVSHDPKYHTSVVVVVVVVVVTSHHNYTLIMSKT